MGKDHCMTGLQFNEIGFDQKNMGSLLCSEAVEFNFVNWRLAEQFYLNRRWVFSGKAVSSKPIWSLFEATPTIRWLPQYMTVVNVAQKFATNRLHLNGIK